MDRIIDNENSNRLAFGTHICQRSQLLHRHEEKEIMLIVNIRPSMHRPPRTVCVCVSLHIQDVRHIFLRSSLRVMLASVKR